VKTTLVGTTILGENPLEAAMKFWKFLSSTAVFD
jgi:hypothetical protein